MSTRVLGVVFALAGVHAFVSTGAAEAPAAGVTEGFAPGLSDTSRLTADDHVRDLEALRQHFRMERMTLIGLSWGSGLAARYASAHPDRVERLLLVSPMPPARTPYCPERMARIQELLGPDQVARLRDLEAGLPAAPDAEIRDRCREITRLSLRLYVVDEAKLHRGPGDRCDIPLAATREWAARLSDSRLLLVPEAGHELFVDQPAAFLRAVETFLSGRYPEGAVAVPGS